ASANAKHCICQRKALHLPTQSFASAIAKLCIRHRKALHVPTTFAEKGLHLGDFPMFFSEPFLGGSFLRLQMNDYSYSIKRPRDFCFL
ncbi:MAG: hypothetical protein SOX54_06905, partial [Prevotella sp.]|nr:hypothetical protein [Prevotella sp.]